MKVGIVIEHYDPRRGGVEQWTGQFVGHLGANGHDVHLIARSFADGLEAEGVTQHAVPLAKGPSGKGRLAFAAAAEDIVGRLGLDVVHDTGCGWACDVFQPHGGSRRASARQNLLLLPRVLRPWKRQIARWTPRYREFERLLTKQYVQDGRLFVALSKMVQRDFVELHGVPEENIRLVYNGVDVRRFSPAARTPFRDLMRARLGVRDDEVLSVIVAHNWALKGVSTLLSAHERLRAAGLPSRVVVVGGKPQAARSAVVTSEGATVHYAGPVDDAVPYYAAADAYIHPTFYDPCSLVVLEALACGLPVVTSRFNGAGELVTPGVQGALVDDPANGAELAAAMRPLFDESRRMTMGAAARRLAEAHTLARNCDEIAAVYEEAAARKGNVRSSAAPMRRAG